MANPDSPLNDLYKSDYDFKNHSYPSNLGAANRGHWINFYINVHNNTKYETGQIITNMVGTAQSLQNANKGNYITTDKIKSYPIPVVDIKTPVLTLGRQTKRIKEAIALYMPDTVNVNYGATWETTSLTDALGKIGMAGQLGVAFAEDEAKWTKSLQTLASNPGVQAEVASMLAEKAGIDAQGVIMHAAGTALNPQLEVTFKGVDLRTFQFDFVFAPRNVDEARSVQNIITSFKFHMAPEISRTGKGRYMVPPSEFDIEFIKDGIVNDRIHKVTTCVLQSMNVDYAPNGWATFVDGAPVQSRMTLQFEEVEIITKERIVQGY